MNTPAMNPDLAQALARVAELESELARAADERRSTIENYSAMIRELNARIDVGLLGLDSVQGLLDETNPLESEIRSAGHELRAARRTLRGAK